MIHILEYDTLAALKQLDTNSVDLVWSDPPYNTGTIQRHDSSKRQYTDRYSHYAQFIEPILTELVRVVKPKGQIYLMYDYREVHTVAGIMNRLLNVTGPAGELIWCSELGAISKKSWTNKHWTTLWYALSDDYTFHFNEVPTIERKSPGKGYTDPKKMHSVITYTMSNSDKERLGYPNQKPEFIVRPIVEVCTNEGDTVLDPFAGSGTLGAVAAKANRNAILIDSSPEACKLMRRRLLLWGPRYFNQSTSIEDNLNLSATVEEPTE